MSDHIVQTKTPQRPPLMVFGRGDAIAAEPMNLARWASAPLLDGSTPDDRTIIERQLTWDARGGRYFVLHADGTNSCEWGEDIRVRRIEVSA